MLNVSSRSVVAIFAATLALSACQAAPNNGLPPSHHADGSLYWPAWCQDRDALRALGVPMMPVPRNSPLLLSGDAAGRYMPSGIPGKVGTAFIRSDLAGHAKDDAEDHERCHRMTEILTGSAEFHR